MYMYIYIYIYNVIYIYVYLYGSISLFALLGGSMMVAIGLLLAIGSYWLSWAVLAGSLPADCQDCACTLAVRMLAEGSCACTGADCVNCHLQQPIDQ